MLVRFDHVAGDLHLPELNVLISAMRSGLQSYLFSAAVALLAACQSPPANQGTQPNKPGYSGAPPTTPTKYEVGSFDPFHPEPGMGLRGASYLGRGP